MSSWALLAILVAALVVGGALTWSLTGLNRDARSVAPPGSAYRGSYDAEQALARATPRPGLWARLRARLRVRRVARQGELLPRGYGVAWVCWNRPEAVCYPIPLNVAAGWAREAWLWFKRGGRDVGNTPAEAYEAGRRDERAQWVGYINDPIG